MEDNSTFSVLPASTLSSVLKVYVGAKFLRCVFIFISED